MLSNVLQKYAPTNARGIARLAHLVAGLGLATLVVRTVGDVYQAAPLWIDGVLLTCQAVFAGQWLWRLWFTFRLHRTKVYLRSFHGVADAVAALAVPLAFAAGAAPDTAWLFAIAWLLKIVPGFAGMRQLRRVIVLEANSLLSVAVLFLVVLFVASVAIFGLEHDTQPSAFASLPGTFYWAVTTLTTTGYGDVVPVTPLGRVVAALVMISGLGVFGLWTGILATGFAAEMRRSNFLKTWEAVSKVPFFAALGPAAIADVTNMLRTIELPPHVTLIRKGETGDCMYFLVSGAVEVELPGRNVRLGEGAFFGEMALLGDNIRSATIVTSQMSRLLVLELIDFRVLMARHPDLAATIDAEARRRAAENS